MSLWQDGLLAGLAAVGLASLLWLLAGAVLRPSRRCLQPVLAFLPVRGQADSAEYTLREIERLRRQYGLFGRIVLVDCGLDEVGREQVMLLADSRRGVEFCTPEQTQGYWN
jgi:hypothetical protein